MGQGLRGLVGLAAAIVLIANAAPSASAEKVPGTFLEKCQAPFAGSAAELRARGLALGFNLDHQEALATFKAAIAADPEHPTAYRLYAATLWIKLLFQQGAVTAEDYLGQARSEVVRTPSPPEVDAEFRAYLSKALELAEKRARLNPSDPDAHFHVGAAQGFLTSYQATVEGRVIGGFRAARRAYKEHERVLEIDPRRADAGLIVGMYRYGVSTLSAPLRLLAGIAGFGGGKERGLRLEAGSTAMRAGRPVEARAAIEAGLAMLARDPRPRAFGEEARWRFHHGAALVALRETEAARRELQLVHAVEAPEWLRGRTHTELGKLADLAGNRVRATEEYRRAERICIAQDDTDGAKEAARLARTPYR